MDHERGEHEAGISDIASPETAGAGEANRVRGVIVRWGGWKIALWMFGLALLVLLPQMREPGTVIGTAEGDVHHQFLTWRGFAASEIRAGNFPEWNDRIFGGNPFHATLQSALLYPPNVVYWVLPLGWATNLVWWFHLGMVGTGVGLWVRWRGVSWWGSVIAGAVVMLGGSMLMRVYVGHLANAPAAVWFPWLLLGLEMCVGRSLNDRAVGWMGRRGARWMGVMIIGLSGGLMVHAGHPQYAYYAVILGGMYGLVRVVCSRAWGAALAMGCGAALAGLMSMPALLPALERADELGRSGGLSPGEAASYAMPPENLLTLVSPVLFGISDARDGELEYVGRWFSWENHVYVGCAAVVLMWVGVRLNRSMRWISLGALVVVVMAMGFHTPLYEWLYTSLPGWDQFRGTSKLMFHATVMGSLLVGMGFDRLRAVDSAGGIEVERAWVVGRRVAWVLAGVLLLGAMLMWERGSGRGGFMDVWSGQIVRMGETHDPARLRNMATWERASEHVAVRLAIAGLMMVGLAVLMGFKRRRAEWMGAVVLVELMVAGWIVLVRSPVEVRMDAGVERVVNEMSQSDVWERVLIARQGQANLGMRLGFENAWGYEPLALRRWVSLLADSQGQSLDAVPSSFLIRKMDERLFGLMGVRWVVLEGEDAPRQIDEPMPRAWVVHEVEVIGDKARRVARLREPGFDARRAVVMETAVDVDQSAKMHHGVVADHDVVDVDVSRVEVMERVSSDEVRLVVRMHRPGVVVVNRAYSAGWRAWARELSGEESRELLVLPGNHAQQAMVLGAGRYELRMKYGSEWLRWAMLAGGSGLVLASGCGVIGMRTRR